MDADATQARTCTQQNENRGGAQAQACRYPHHMTHIHFGGSRTSARHGCRHAPGMVHRTAVVEMPEGAYLPRHTSLLYNCTCPFHLHPHHNAGASVNTQHSQFCPLSWFTSPNAYPQLTSRPQGPGPSGQAVNLTLLHLVLHFQPPPPPLPCRSPPPERFTLACIRLPPSFNSSPF